MAEMHHAVGGTNSSLGGADEMGASCSGGGGGLPDPYLSATAELVVVATAEDLRRRPRPTPCAAAPAAQRPALPVATRRRRPTPCATPCCRPPLTNPAAYPSPLSR